MKNTIKSTLLVLLTIACTYIVKSQACTGYHNTISYPGTSSALGSDNNVYGRNCFISGTGNNVYGRSSVAIGTANTILSVNYSDYIAFAIGDNNSSTSNMSFAIGDNNTSDNTFSFAIGRSNQSHASTSYAIGYSNTNTSLASPSFAVGFNNTNSAQHSISIGERLSNTTGGIMMGINKHGSNYKPTLFISTTQGSNETGKVGIGNVISPSAKLHIKADSSGEGEDADIMLEPTASGKYATIYFKTTDNYIRMRNTAGLEFNAPRFNFQTGKVGIGNVSAPQATLHIKAYSSENANIMLQTTDNTKDAAIIFCNTSNTISVGSNNMMNFAATSYSFTTGKVGIGCVNNMNDFALAVQGGVVSTKVSVLDIDSWPDFVFGNSYKLMNLYELEQYINANQHLPDVPAAQEVSANGIDLGEMNAILLQKVEELTLHIIELQKQIDELKAR